MSTNMNKHLTQIRDLLEKLEEAAEHFSELVKQKELHQSTSMLSTIVERFEAVKMSLNTSDETLNEQTAKLEQYLLMIAQQLEQGSFIRISEIL